MELIATCAFGLEKLVHDEIKKLGLWTIKTEDGRIFFKGEELDLVRANLWLRCADRVQIKIGEFTATTFEELFNQVNALDWGKYIGTNDAFPIAATSVKSILHSEPAIQSIVKKAIVKKLQQKNNLEVFPENSGAVFQIIVKSNKDQFVISIDSSGESLHKRGYRKHTNVAPIKETLAAALVKLSDWKPGRTLIDAFCGSGTIGIEAALIAHNMAPGLNRSFAFEKWPWMNTEKIAEAKEEARKAAKPEEECRIYCSDIDAKMITVAQENAKNAGFEKIHFEQNDFNTYDFNTLENCTFISNPPYGERLEEKSHVEEMMRKFGKKFSQTKNCSLFFITSHENLQQLFERDADKNRKLFNGNIRCYLFSYFSK
ncbi:MAG: class I SAM-dependent RNA methyltransferase [Patescibacteria group bacterium]